MHMRMYMHMHMHGNNTIKHSIELHNTLQHSTTYAVYNSTELHNILQHSWTQYEIARQSTTQYDPACTTQYNIIQKISSIIVN